MDKLKTFARFTGDERFRSIAEDSLDSFEKFHSKLLNLRSKEFELLSNCEDPENPPYEYYELNMQTCHIDDKRDKAYDVAVVFTAMYFEAFIYDYAASCLGDRYSKDHLDKLDPISKWIVIPKLVTGREISKSGQAYEALKRLYKDRNSLVHLKSRNAIFNPEDLSKYMQTRENNLVEGVDNCRKAFKHITSELFAIHPEHPRLRLINKRNNRSKHSDSH